MTIDGYPEYPKEVPCTSCNTLIEVDQPDPDGWICVSCLLDAINPRNAR